MMEDVDNGGAAAGESGNIMMMVIVMGNHTWAMGGCPDVPKNP